MWRDARIRSGYSPPIFACMSSGLGVFTSLAYDPFAAVRKFIISARARARALTPARVCVRPWPTKRRSSQLEPIVIAYWKCNSVPHRNPPIALNVLWLMLLHACAQPAHCRHCRPFMPCEPASQTRANDVFFLLAAGWLSFRESIVRLPCDTWNRLRN